MIGLAFFLIGMAIFVTLLEGSRFIEFIKVEAKDTHRTFTCPVFVNPKGIDYTTNPTQYKPYETKYIAVNRHSFPYSK